ncbi:MAG: FKBP-type peptidyl-prolyl cis-trans isomerase [Fibrobacter sp.]|nr:FKBP-type peptidyl-prolyl cis-trans isomerase [Fibrobacter sp.]
MSKLKIFLVLLVSVTCFAVPFKIETVKEGSGTPIRAGQLIKVHYKGYLYQDSTKLANVSKIDSISAAAAAGVASTADSASATSDSEAPAQQNLPFADSYANGEPLEFTIGMGMVIPGWEKGLMGMKVGEVRKLYIPYQMAYGENSLEGIPAFSDLYFEVELVAAEKPMEPDSFPKNVESLKWKETAKGLKVYDEKIGTGKPAAMGSVLKTHYTGWLLSGRKFGSSKDMGKPLQAVLGAGKMIKGWEVGLEGMREGGIRWFRVSPNMGYGATAYSMIPANSTLIFKVELVSSEIDEAIAASMDFFPDTTALTFENGPEGLRYAIIKQGEGEPAQKGETARVHYTGWLTNGYKFDSSRDRGQEFAFPLGGGRVIRGWELGVQGMLPGEKRILVVPPGIGYGNRAAGPIPAGSTLIFAVEYLGQD